MAGLKVEALDTFEMEELLRWFFHHMGVEQRNALMKRYPQHYNKLVGYPLMRVARDEREVLQQEHLADVRARYGGSEVVTMVKGGGDAAEG
jgi:hypothetical protein